MPQLNFLIIMADQMAGPAAPFNGHTVTRLPNLQSLAQDAVIFDSAYCASPLCAPSRAALVTGQLCSKIGAYDNAAEFAPSIPTLGHYLRDLGYYTCLCGKMHFVGPDQIHGFEERLTTDIYPADFGWTPDWERPDHRPSWYHNVDDKVGQILRTLAATGLDQNTIVIFTSDHGDMMGERGLWYKMVFFEWAARVPFVAASSTSAVSLILTSFMTWRPIRTNCATWPVSRAMSNSRPIFERKRASFGMLGRSTGPCFRASAAASWLLRH